MLYASLRALIRLALRLFYRVEVKADTLPPRGPVMVVGNHPNALVDPALVCLATERPLTFLAKAPLFGLPGLGWVLRRLGALPVYRRQDDPAKMGQNEGTLDAAAQALVDGGAIVIFPEGRSHSEPALGTLKTGAARILFKAAAAGARPQVVPMGLTYEEKTRFRSAVHVEVGAPLHVADFLPAGASEEAEAVRRLTERITEGLQAVTLNLQAWGDLPLLKTAEAFYALRRGEPLEDAERRRRFARGLEQLRAERPEAVEALRADAAALHRRLELVRAAPGDLSLLYRRPEVARFVARQLLSLLVGLPLFGVGMALFCVPFLSVRALTSARHEDPDMQATVKLLATALVAPLWWALLGLVGWRIGGVALGVAMLLGAPVLAVFTRYFLERWGESLHDLRVFFTLGGHARLKARLLADGETLARRVEALAEGLSARSPTAESVAGPSTSS